jgi:molybdopterin/thiamine biosynthesis adenylyltransferase
MDDESLLRYSRHILLDEFGIDGQARVDAAHAVVVGVGGLGSPVALYLAAAGVGRITLIDDDTVDLTNLQRQIAHGTDRVGMTKVDSAARSMRVINPTISIATLAVRADAALLDDWVAGAGVVLDCSDNFATRQIVNRACVDHAVPLVSGAAIRFDGQLCVYDVRKASSPCYACVFPPDETFEETRCAVLGAFGPVVGTIGALQASEALKLLAGIESSNPGNLLMFDGRRTSFETVGLTRNPTCGVCAAHRAALAEPVS